MRRGIRGCIGCSIVGVEKPRSRRLKPLKITPATATLRRRLVGNRIDHTDRVGKRVVVWLDSGDALVFEPRMTGLVLVADPPNKEHLRFRLQLDRSAAARNKNDSRSDRLSYWDRRGLGSVRLFTRDEFQDNFGPHKLGPDALTACGDLLSDRLGHSQREIKVALLDQQAIAGIGNLYAAEILHVAGIHPQASCRRLKAAHWEAIATATVQVLSEAIRYEGSTLNDGTYRNALNQNGRYQNHHRVYKRDGQPCLRCGRGTIRRIVQAQRSTFFCPACQRKGGRLRKAC